MLKSFFKKYPKIYLKKKLLYMGLIFIKKNTQKKNYKLIYNEKNVMKRLLKSFLQK